MLVVILIVLGLCFGSFVNALVWRYHEQATSKQKRRDPKFSISKGRSMCVHCHHELAWYDLIPVLSWLSLGGKCRYCHKKIGDNPLVEIATPLLFLLSYIYWPYDFSISGTILFVIWLAIVILLLALALYDLKWMLLPNRLVFPLQGLALTFALISLVASGNNLLAGLGNLALSVTIAGGLFYVLNIVSNGRWIGGGDAKLGLALGLILMLPEYSLMMIFFASILGSLAAIPAIIRRKTSKFKIPFGPFLILASFIVFLAGPSIIHWYQNYLLI